MDSMKNVLVLALDGVLDSTLAITLDTFRTAEGLRKRAGNNVPIRALVANHRRTIRTGGGMRRAADFTFAEVMEGAVRPDWIVVPGLGLTTREMIATRFTQKDALSAMELLRTARAKNIGASCSSVFLLAEAGLLDGRHATTTWWLASVFRARYPEVKLDEARMLVRDERFTTAGSAFAQLDLALAIVTDTMGAAVAHLCSRYLLIDQRPSQARYMIPSHVRHVDPTVVAAEQWIDANLANPVSITDLAAAMAMSPKTLSRRIAAATGVSPVRFLQRRRVQQAAHLIETTSMTIDAIASMVGYQDGTALRKLIKRELGTTPAGLRTT